MKSDIGTVLATIAFESGSVFLTAENSIVRFGRSSECEVRFAHQPVADTSVPRVAGAIVAIGGRVAVENLSDKVAFDVKTPDGPLETLRPGALLSPRDDRYEIRYKGAHDVHVLLVHRLARPRHLTVRQAAQACDQPPTGAEPNLTDRQWQVLEAFTEPIRQGGTTSATHKQVASRLNWSYATVRVECNAIWGAFKLAGIPMRQFPDKRDAIIDAAVRHRLRRPGAG